MGEGWYNLGICLRDEGDIEAALLSFRNSLARQPDYGKSYEALGMLLYQMERIPEAAAVYAAWTRQDPSNPIAKHMSLAMSQRDMPERAADEYVRRLFDDSAKSFDADLRRLDYRAPALVAAALEEHAHGRILGEVLDAGCGTGLCGPLVRKVCKKLHGVDLSPQMIELARQRACYDELDVAELSTFLRSKVNVLDAVISADTLVYFGDLEVPFRAARQVLSPRGGVLIFTLESSREGEPRDYRLEVHGRFTHTEDYVRRALQGSGLRLEKLAHEALRKEGGRDVNGMLVVARKR
jgi:predicted TPR repeat methyltransferase